MVSTKLLTGLALTIAIATGCTNSVVNPDPPDVGEKSQAMLDSELLDLLYINSIGLTSDIVISSSVSGESFQVTNDAAQDITPSWATDFKYILFSTNRDGNYEIYSIRKDGTRAKRLTNDPARDDSPSMSPDGTKIAFARETSPGRQQIFVMNRDGSNVVKISQGNFGDIQPSWSPDGTKIVFASDRDAKYGNNQYLEVYTMNADGSGVQRLTNNDDGNDYYPVWSPDGTKIAFTSDRSTNQRCYAFALEVLVMNSNGSGVTSASDNCYGDAAPAFNPNGGELAFLSDRSASAQYKWDLFIVGTGGSPSTPRRLTTSGTISGPRWGKAVSWSTTDPQ